MSIGIRRNIITVQDLYNYALKHNYVNSDAFIVLEIIKKSKMDFMSILLIINLHQLIRYLKTLKK